MSDGLGAGFGGLLLLAVLSGLAVLLALSLVSVFAFRRQTETVPSGLRHLSVALLAGAVLVAGFAVVALSDEAVALAGVFFALVFVPLIVVGSYRHHTTGAPVLDTLTTVGLAWSGPFLIAVVVTFGGLNVLTGVLDVAPGESHQLGFHWIATAVGTAVVVLGTVWLSKYVSHSVHPRTLR